VYKRQVLDNRMEEKMIGEIIAGCGGFGAIITFGILLRTNGKRVDTLDKTKLNKELFAQRVEQIDKDLVKGDKRFEKVEAHIDEQTKISSDQAKSIVAISTSMKSMDKTLTRIESGMNNKKG